MMTRLLSFALIVLATVFGYVLYKQQDVGYINLGLGGFSIETSLLVFGAAILALLFSALILFRIIGLISRGLSAPFFHFKRHFSEKSKYTLSSSLLDIAEGQYKKAEKRLLSEIKNSADPLPLYLAAATAAQEQNAYEQRDEYLQLARDIAQGMAQKKKSGKPNTEIALGLIKAEFQLAHNQLELAIDTLSTLASLSPKHGRVLTLLGEAYRRLSRWKQLRELINKLYEYKALPDEKIQTLEKETWHGLIKDIATPDNAELLCALWEEIPTHLKSSNEFLEFYLYTLKSIRQDNYAAQILQQSLEHNWQNSLVILYADLDVSADNKLLETAEGWLKEHPDNAHLLLALGKMCMKLGLWGKARSYLEASFSIGPLPETCLRLAILFEEKLEETAIARDYYRKGLRMLVDGTIPSISTIEQQKEITPKLKIVSPK